jgi:hypothetical protein
LARALDVVEFREFRVDSTRLVERVRFKIIVTRIVGDDGLHDLLLDIAASPGVNADGSSAGFATR